MFNSKLKTLLLDVRTEHLSNFNLNTTLSENGAVKFSSSGNAFVDQFSKIGSYLAPRTYAEIEKDCQILFDLDPLNAVKFILYLRTITRKTLLGAEDVGIQKGAGLKHESIMRMMWLGVNHPDTFWSNLDLFVSVGSWDDIFTMLKYDLIFQDPSSQLIREGLLETNLDWPGLGEYLIRGIQDPNQVNLIKKYLPQIKSNSKCTTIEAQANALVGKWFAKNHLDDMGLQTSQLFEVYRKFKSRGEAHQWQQKISQRKFDEIDFDKIHGRALQQIINSKFLENQKLEDDFGNWILSKPLAKFTGYPHELFKNIESANKTYQLELINKQFETLVQRGKSEGNKTNLIVVRDTSGSMSLPATGTKQSCGDISKAIALYFSSILEGHFANKWIEFNSSAQLHEWEGNTPAEKWIKDCSDYIGNTNFLSVIDLFCRMKNMGIPEEQFPRGIICISDYEFDAAQLKETNLSAMYSKMKEANFSKEYIENFKVVLWNLQSCHGGDKFETQNNESNVFYFGGYDASVISFLMGGDLKEGETKINEPKNAEELFLSAMNQTILNRVKIITQN